MINLAKEKQIDIYVTEYIDSHSEMFTVWEAKTRYILNYQLETKKITLALKEVENYLNDLKKE